MVDCMYKETMRQEHYTEYASKLKERFAKGLLAELQPLPQWVLWRREQVDGQIKKVPYAPHHGFHASVKKPQSWGTLDQALETLTRGQYNGLGFMLTESDPFSLVDLDHAYNRETKQIISPKAQEIITQLASYTEASPTDGIHILAQATLPGKGIKAGIEMYDRGRFSTITTQILPGTPLTIAERQTAIEALYYAYQPQSVERPRTPTGKGNVISEASEKTRTDAQVWEMACNAANGEAFRELWEGRWTSNPKYFSQGQPDQSRADFQLVKYLLYWTNGDTAQADRLFRQSALMRDKWDDNVNSGGGGHTYGELTIYKARN